MFGKIVIHPAVDRFLQLLDTDPELHRTPLTVISRKLGVSTSHLQHLVRRDLSTTCRKLIRSKCVERLSQLLQDHPEQSISEIAYQQGLEPQTLYRHFNAVLGASPGTVRKGDIPKPDTN